MLTWQGPQKSLAENETLHSKSLIVVVIFRQVIFSNNVAKFELAQTPQPPRSASCQVLSSNTRIQIPFQPLVDVLAMRIFLKDLCM